MMYKASKDRAYNMRNARLDSGLSIQKLADKAGVSKDTVFNLEHCKKKSIQPATLELISSALNITVEEYINGKI